MTMVVTPNLVAVLRTIATGQADRTPRHIAEITRLTGVAETNVSAILHRLEEHGLIIRTVIHAGGRGGRRTIAEIRPGAGSAVLEILRDHPYQPIFTDADTDTAIIEALERRGRAA